MNSTLRGKQVAVDDVVFSPHDSISDHVLEQRACAKDEVAMPVV